METTSKQREELIEKYKKIKNRKIEEENSKLKNLIEKSVNYNLIDKMLDRFFNNRFKYNDIFKMTELEMREFRRIIKECGESRKLERIENVYRG